MFYQTFEEKLDLTYKHMKKKEKKNLLQHSLEGQYNLASKLHV